VGLAVVLPIIVIFIFGAFDMLSADRESARAGADDTIAQLLGYFGGKLLDIVISDLGGEIAGVFIDKKIQ